jgi:hypothetical protein
MATEGVQMTLLLLAFIIIIIIIIIMVVVVLLLLLLLLPTLFAQCKGMLDFFIHRRLSATNENRQSPARTGAATWKHSAIVRWTPPARAWWNFRLSPFF